MERAQSRWDRIYSKLCGTSVLAVFLAGVILRYRFICVENRPSDPANILGDASWYVYEAFRFFDPSFVPTLYDTLFPPGTPFYFALLRALDPTLRLIDVIQWQLSCLIPLLLGVTAERLYGRGCALWVVVVSSLYFPFWEYFGYFISEGPFMVSLLGSFFLLVASLQARSSVSSAMFGAAGGVALGISAACKSCSLFSAALVLLVLMGFRRRMRFRLFPTVASAFLGLLVILIPTSIHATRLNEGRFLLIANDAHRTFLLGHQGRVGLTWWYDDKRSFQMNFINPSAPQHQYVEERSYRFGPYEAAPNYAAGWKWMLANPVDALLLSFEHVFDCFAFVLPWPGYFRPYVRWTAFFAQFFIAVLLLPAVVHVTRAFRRFAATDPRVLGDAMVAAAAVSVYILAFFFLGEGRYRISYDGFMLLLAARAIFPSRCWVPSEACGRAIIASGSSSHGRFGRVFRGGGVKEREQSQAVSDGSTSVSKRNIFSAMKGTQSNETGSLMSVESSSSAQNLSLQTKSAGSDRAVERSRGEVKRSPWIIDPWFDLLFVCGGIPLLLIAANVSSFGWQSPPSWSSTQTRSAALLLSLVLVGQHLFANSHNMATYLRIWGSDEDRERFRFHRTWLVLFFLPLFILGLLSTEVTGAYVYVYLMAVFWHYAAQCYGVALIYCFKRNYILKPWEKSVMKLCMTSLSAYAILRIVSLRANSPAQWYGVPLPFWGPFPPLIYHTAGMVFSASILVFSFIVLKKLVQEGKIFPLPSLMILLSVIALGLTDSAQNALLWFYVPAFFHGTQYLAICISYALKEKGEAQSMSVRKLFCSKLAGQLFATTVVIGTFFYVALPHIFSQFGFDYAVVSGLVLAIVNFHHFLTDAAIWRLRDSRCREILLA